MWRPALVILLGLTMMYFATAPKASWTHDPLTNMVTAWSFGTRQSPFLPEYEPLLKSGALEGVMGVVVTDKGPVSFYPPGSALHAAPLYAVLGTSLQQVPTQLSDGTSVELAVPPVWPGAFVASVTTAAAASFLYLALRRLGRNKNAAAAALIFAFGTGAWSVSSQALWQHGPTMLWVALGLVLADTGGVLAGIAWIPAIITRPLTVVIGGILHAYQVVRDRRWFRAVPLIGLAAGTVLLVMVNRQVFGVWSITGGYALTSAVSLPDTNLLRWMTNSARALIDPQRGLFIYSPFLIVLLPGLGLAWRTAPTWVRGAAIGAIAYLLVQYNIHEFGGGDRFFGYRYPLEALVASGPVLFLAHQKWVSGRPFRERLFSGGVALAVALQLMAVVRQGI